jgi:hypothetical protein
MHKQVQRLNICTTYKSYDVFIAFPDFAIFNLRQVRLYVYTLRFVVYDSYSSVCNGISTRKVVAFQISP